MTHDKSERVQLFLDKLRKKNQTEDQYKRAAHAVSLYFAMQRPEAIPQATAEQSDRQSTEAAKPAHFRVISANPNIMKPATRKSPIPRSGTRFSQPWRQR